MRYIFLIVGIWNMFGAVNFIFFPDLMARQYGYPMGNPWETYFMGGIAVVFSLIYFSFFRREPPENMLYLVYLFALGKFWVFASYCYSVSFHGMPAALAAVVGGGNLVMGLLFVWYALAARRKFRNR